MSPAEIIENLLTVIAIQRMAPGSDKKLGEVQEDLLGMPYIPEAVRYVKEHGNEISLAMGDWIAMLDVRDARGSKA